jgi:putative copper export protein
VGDWPWAAPTARALLYLGAVVALGKGSVAFLDPAWRAGARSVHALPAPRLFAWSGAVALISAPLLLLALQLAALDMSTADLRTLLFDTGWGRGWSQLAAACVAASVLLVLPTTRATAPVLLLAAVGVAAAMGGLGHAAADERWPIGARILDALHVGAMGAWIGGLAMTLLITRSPTFALRDAAWRTFSRSATIMAPVAVLTGVGSGARLLLGTSASAAAAGDYARLLLLKTALVMVVLIIGAAQRARIARGQQPDRTRMRVEVGVAAAVLAVTAVLTGTEPPGE